MARRPSHQAGEVEPDAVQVQPVQVEAQLQRVVLEVAPHFWGPEAAQHFAALVVERRFVVQAEALPQPAALEPAREPFYATQPGA